MLTLLLSPLALIPARVEANTITLGEIELSGSFTLNPAYNFNQPTAQPFGSFTDLTVIQASGIFTPLMHRGATLVMNTPNVLSPPFTAPLESKPLAGQMVWSIGGYTMDTTWDIITGADFTGRNVFGFFDLSGHHFDHAHQALGTSGSWDFTAPPYDISNFTSPVTGPITLTINETFQNNGHGDPQPSSLLVNTQAFDNRHGVPEPSSLLASTQAFDNGHGVPEPSSLLVSTQAFDNGHGVPEPSSVLLLSLSIAGLLGWQWKRKGITLS